MSNPAFKPSEGKREEFRNYLEKNGVMDALTKVLVNLYEEPDKPEDALEFIRDRLATHAGHETYRQMKEKQEEQQTQIEKLAKELEELKAGPAAPSSKQEDTEMGVSLEPPGDDTTPTPDTTEAAPQETPAEAEAAPAETPE